MEGKHYEACKEWHAEIAQVDVASVGEPTSESHDLSLVTAASVPHLEASNPVTQDIRALFTGTDDGQSVRVLVQRFAPQQVLSRKFSLLLEGNTFVRLSRPALALDSKLLCVIADRKVRFKSFHNLRSVFDLLDLYREATNEELDSFANLPGLMIADIHNFKESADQVARKLIHAIGKSEVLNQHSVAEIQAAANAVGVSVNVANEKLVIPETRAELKTLLRFLDDGLYEAPLSHQRYITNSKRRV